jgi:hypothetical protein
MAALKMTPKSEPLTGAGTELKAIFGHFGIRPCNRCLALANEMDRNGTAWCRENLDRLAGEITGEARRRGWLVGQLAKLSVRRAILQAIERAERNAV